MTNDQNIAGNSNLGFQNITNSNIDITQIIGRAFEYNDLLRQLERTQKLFDRTP